MPRGKRADIALTYIYGIGRATALQILDATGVNWTRNIDDLDADEVNEIRKEIETNHKVEGDLRREVSSNIKRMAVCVTAEACLCTASAPTPMRAPARGRAVARSARRSKPSRPFDGRDVLCPVRKALFRHVVRQASQALRK